MKTDVSQSRGLLLGVLTMLLLQPAPGHSQSSAVFGQYSGLTVTGLVGSARSLEYVNALSSSAQSWIALSNFNLASSSVLVVDPTSSTNAARFYRPQPAGVAFRMFPGLHITGAVGSTNVIQYDNAGTWT